MKFCGKSNDIATPKAESFTSCYGSDILDAHDYLYING
jgi:hypothetical protein